MKQVSCWSVKPPFEVRVLGTPPLGNRALNLLDNHTDLFIADNGSGLAPTVINLEGAADLGRRELNGHTFFAISRKDGPSKYQGVISAIIVEDALYALARQTVDIPDIDFVCRQKGNKRECAKTKPH